MGIADVVDVSITRDSVTVTRQGFGTMLILSEEPTFSDGDTYRYYASMAEVDADDEIPTDDDLYAALGEAFSQNPKLSRICVGLKAAETAVDTTLSELVEAGADFYGIVMTDRTYENQALLADWAELNDRLAGVASAEAEDKGADLSGIAWYISTDNDYDRTFCVYHSDAAESFPEIALMARQFSQDPGSSTYANQSLTGISADTLTTTEKTAIKAKNANYYVSIAGVSLTQGGTVGSGEYIDVIVGLDWLKARMAERVFGAIANEEKIPYTDAGVASLAGLVMAQLMEGVKKNVLADDPAPTIQTVAVADVDAADKAARLYPDITWQATLAGAIHKVEIAGRVSV